MTAKKSAESILNKCFKFKKNIVLVACNVFFKFIKNNVYNILMAKICLVPFVMDVPRW